MQHSESDSSYLWDIDDACRDILNFIENTSYADFENNKMKRFAVERQLLVVGEAANHLSDECRNNNPNIPWKFIIGLRNIIAHDYGEILVNRIYKIATENVAVLKDEIGEIINS
jgi:uncharacterized protein with HEPN domain